MLGNKELLPASVQTFVNIDFYNHESKHSDIKEGFEPIFNTQFSFKNNVDNFYIGYLEKEHIVIEFFLA